MKEKYESVEIKIIGFENSDIIATSIDIDQYDTPFQPV